MELVLTAAVAVLFCITLPLDEVTVTATAQSISGLGLFAASSCYKAQDCYVIPRVLELACHYKVNKCSCRTTIQSIHRVAFDNVTGECRMSKYGPCGSNHGTGLTVGCLDGFKCVDNQCRSRDREPNAAHGGVTIPRETPYEFVEEPCDRSECLFNRSDRDVIFDLRFKCGPRENCVCQRILFADAPSPIWDLRNYDGAHNCSVGKFGPCGTRGGMNVDCHGHGGEGMGIECVNGRCIDPKNPIAGVGGDCELDSDCDDELICGGGSICITRKSLDYNERCKSTDECSGTFVCRINTPDGRFAFGASRVCAPQFVPPIPGNHIWGRFISYAANLVL